MNTLFEIVLYAEDDMENFVIDMINRYGYLGICLLIAIENVFPPIPSEIILTFGGFMTKYSSMNLWGVIIAATIGSVIGAIILYSLGHCLKAERLEKFFDSKLGKMLRLKKEDIKKAEIWFNKHGAKAVFLCRFVPIVRSLISIPAGMAGMELGSFFVLTLLGTFIWNIVLVYLGRFAGDTWEVAVTYIDAYSMVVLIIFIIVILLFGFLSLRKKLSKNGS